MVSTIQRSLRRQLKKLIAKCFFFLEFMRERLSDSNRLIDLKNIKNILIVEMQGFGDVIAVFPTAEALRARFPEARLTLISQKVAAELFNGLSLFDEIIPLGVNKTKLGMIDFIRSLPKLRRNEYDLFIVPSWSLRHTSVSLLVRSKARVGYLHDHSLQMLYHNDYRVEAKGIRSIKGIVTYFKEEHIITRALKTLAPLGIQPEDRQYHIEVSQTDAASILSFLKQNFKLDGNQKFIVIATGGVWKRRTWQLEKWKKLIDKVSQGNTWKFFVIGSKEEQQRNNFLCDNVRIFNLCGHLSLTQLPALIKRSHIFIGVDSGPMHLAAALGKPVIALFGPNIPEVSGPKGSLCLVIQKEMKCRPCNQDFCFKPKGQRCMDLISPDDVIDAYNHLRQKMIDK